MNFSSAGLFRFGPAYPNGVLWVGVGGNGPLVTCGSPSEGLVVLIYLRRIKGTARLPKGHKLRW